MRTKTKKATFNLPTEVLADLDAAVSRGMAPSKKALVEQALIKELRDLQRMECAREWAEGARDALLLKDIEDTEAAFRSADAVHTEIVDPSSSTFTRESVDRASALQKTVFGKRRLAGESVELIRYVREERAKQQ